MFCVADEMAAFDEQAKMVIFAVTIGTETYDQLYDTDSEEPGSGGEFPFPASLAVRRTYLKEHRPCYVICDPSRSLVMESNAFYLLQATSSCPRAIATQCMIPSCGWATVSVVIACSPRLVDDRNFETLLLTLLLYVA